MSPERCGSISAIAQACSRSTRRVAKTATTSCCDPAGSRCESHSDDSRLRRRRLPDAGGSRLALLQEEPHVPGCKRKTRGASSREARRVRTDSMGVRRRLHRISWCAPGTHLQQEGSTMGDVKNAPPGQSGNPGTPKEREHENPDRGHREEGGMGGSGRENPSHERDRGTGGGGGGGGGGQSGSDPNRQRGGSGGSGGSGGHGGGGHST